MFCHIPCSQIRHIHTYTRSSLFSVKFTSFHTVVVMRLHIQPSFTFYNWKDQTFEFSALPQVGLQLQMIQDYFISHKIPVVSSLGLEPKFRVMILLFVFFRLSVLFDITNLPSQFTHSSCHLYCSLRTATWSLKASCAVGILFQVTISHNLISCFAAANCEMMKFHF